MTNTRYRAVTISLIFSLTTVLVDCQGSSCLQTVDNLSDKCPILTNLLDLSDKEIIKQEFIRDIQSVLDGSCCEGLAQLQFQRCFCDIGFLQALQSGKTIDNFTMYLLIQSVKFECGFQIEYGSNCTNFSPSQSTTTQLQNSQPTVIMLNESYFKHNNSQNNNDSSFSLFPQQIQEKNSENDTEIVYGNLLFSHENIDRDEYNFIQQYYQQQQEQQQQQQIPQFQVPQDIYNLRDTSKVVYSNNSIQNSEQNSYVNSVISFIGNTTFQQQQQQEHIFFSKNASHEFLPSNFSAPFNLSAQNNSPFQKIPNVNKTKGILDVHNVQHASNVDGNNKTKGVLNAHNVQHASNADKNFDQIYLNSEIDKDLYVSYEDQEFRKGDLVFKSVDKDDDQLKKQPFKLEPQVEQLFYSEAVTTYIEWAVNNQRQKQNELDFAGNFSTQSDYAPQEENQWQYRAAHVDCDGSAMMDMAYYKDASIIGECIRQAHKTLQTQEYLVLVAPKNPGFLKWLRLDANMSLVQFFSNDDQVKEVVGRHVAFSRPLNFKGMIDGQVITLHSMQGALLTISLKDQQYMVNGMNIDTIHYSCDGVILVTSTPIPAPFMQTRTQEPQIQSGLEALIPLLMFPNESATTPSALPQFKLNNVDLLEGGQPPSTYVVQEQQEQAFQQDEFAVAQYQQQQEQQCSVGSSIFELLKESFPGFAYLASQQGFQDVLANSKDITVFVPEALGQGIKIDDYIMSQTLQRKDYAWLGSGVELSMYSGGKQRVETMQNGDIAIGGAHIKNWDSKACNGVMHVMENRFNSESTIIPPEAEAKPPLSIVIPELPPADEVPVTEISLPLSPPPPPLTLHLPENFSLIQVKPQPQPNIKSNDQIHSLVSQMMSIP